MSIYEATQDKYIRVAMRLIEVSPGDRVELSAEEVARIPAEYFIKPKPTPEPMPIGEDG